MAPKSTPSVMRSQVASRVAPNLVPPPSIRAIVPSIMSVATVMPNRIPARK
jgi:hypothetical protein